MERRAHRAIFHRALLGGLLLLLGVIVLAAGPARARTQHWTITHHEITAELEVQGHRLQVQDQVDFASAESADAPLHLLLHRDLHLEEVRLDGVPLQVSEEEGFTPRHFWRRPPYDRLDDYEAAREITVAAPAGGWPSNPRLEFHYSGAVYDSLHPPKVAYQRSFDTTTGLIDERGAFLSGVTFWVPWCGEGTFTYRLDTVTPPGWESVSQGRRTAHEEGPDGRVHTQWTEEHPMGEVYLVAGPYTVREAQGDRVKLYTFTYRDTPEELCRSYLDAAGRYIDMYSRMLGPYPFSKFALVENWWQTGFGMPSFTLLGDKVIRLPFIVHTSYGHEILHNWWGNGVFVDYDQGNWCEGLTTYLADHLYKLQESQQAAIDYRRAQLQGYLDYAVSGGKDFPLREFKERESASTQAVGYGKTMMVFHMAELRAGHEDFLTALRDFYQAHLFEEASWDDLVEAFVSSDDDPSWQPWFEQWIGRPGALQLSAHLEDGASRLVLTQEEPFYEVDVPVRVTLAGGGVRDLEVSLEGASAGLDLPPAAALIEVDPDCDLFRLLKRSEIPPALSQTFGATHSVAVIGRDTSGAVREALEGLAHDWARNQDMVVVSEEDYRDDPSRSVWLLGEGPLLRRTLERIRAYGDQPRRILDRAEQEGLSAVITLRDSDDENRSWSIVRVADAGVVEALGRKLPHYGRYSYLLFEGEKNVEKGSFRVENSPLRFQLEESE